MPRCRLAGSFLAILLSWQAAGGALAAASQSAGAECCCHHGDKCECPTCYHGRAIENGQRHIRTCGAGSGHLLPAQSRPALPPRVIADQPVPPGAVPDSAPPIPAVSPDLEVPTPPPLG